MVDLILGNKKKKIKKGQSGIITTVLLILLVIAAVAIAGNIIYGIVKKSSGEINIGAFAIQLRVKHFMYDSTDNVAYVIIERGSGGSGELDGMQFIFYDASNAILARYIITGGTLGPMAISIDATGGGTNKQLPKVNERILYYFMDPSLSTAKKVGIIPIVNNKNGPEIIGQYEAYSQSALA